MFMEIHPKDWLPHRDPFLFIDEVISIEPRIIVARKTFNASMDTYRGHYPGNPITPGVLLCEAMFQAAGILVAFESKKTLQPERIPVLSRVEVAKFHAMVPPGETVEMHITWDQSIGRFFGFKGKMTCQKKRVLSMCFVLAYLMAHEKTPMFDEKCACAMC
jgi:3-hydroxyacyl-[acyl-carrier-protein] dehydratase